MERDDVACGVGSLNVSHVGKGAEKGQRGVTYGHNELQGCLSHIDGMIRYVAHLTFHLDRNLTKYDAFHEYGWKQLLLPWWARSGINWWARRGFN